MAIKTTLQYVQTCLSTMDSDEVDAIAETSESMQIANLLSEVYFELLNRQEWEFLKGPLTLTAAADTTQPTRFNLPTGFRHLHNLWYNVDTAGGTARRELIYREPDDFLTALASGSAATGKQLVTLPSQIQFYVRSDRMPTFYTTFDDRSIHCDSFRTLTETSLVSSKVSAYGVVIPTFAVTDTSVPTLPEHMVPLLQATLNATAHLYFKQQQSIPDEARVRRQLAQARQKDSTIASRNHYYANQFGRR